MIKYHDKEWGVPVHNDGLLFEMLILEGAQAGLSWITMESLLPTNFNINEDVIMIFQKYYKKLLNVKGSDSDYMKVKIADTCLSYFNDIYNNLICIRKILTDRGEYHMILGDNVIRGINIPTHKLIADLATKIGFEWSQYYKYQIKDHRTSMPRNNMGGKIKYEYVVVLSKV